MDLVRRRAGTLLGLGLLALFVWSTVVAFAMPNWFDSSEDCELTLGRTDGSAVGVETHVFPPRARCDFGGGEVRDFISPAETTLLTIAAVLIFAVLLVGLGFTVQRLFTDDGVIRSAEGVDLGTRRTAHLASGAVVFTFAFGAYATLNAFAIILGGIAGGLISTVLAATVLACLGAGLDRQVGPLPSTAVGSRRRGATAGLITFAVVFAVTGLTGRLPFPQLWAVPLGAVTYLVVVLAQWRASRTNCGAIDGDAVEQDVLGSPGA
jgi:hypothetical protein